MLIVTRRTDCPSIFVQDLVTNTQRDIPYTPPGQSRYFLPATRSDNVANLVAYLNSLSPSTAFTTTSAAALINATALKAAPVDVSPATISAQANLASGGTFPAFATQAAFTGNAGLTVTAVTGGAAGNSITVALVNPSVANAELNVSVSGSAITVNLGNTAVAGTISSTLAQVVAAINDTAASAALVLASVASVDAGTTAVAVAATNLAGGAATGGALSTAQATYVQQNFLSAHLVETGEVLMSLSSGALSRFSSGSYSYLGVTGAALEALEDDGLTPYSIL